MSDRKADVYDKDGKYVRTYTPEEHGEEYHKLARGYAEKIKGEVHPKKEPKGEE